MRDLGFAIWGRRPEDIEGIGVAEAFFRGEVGVLTGRWGLAGGKCDFTRDHDMDLLIFQYDN
jgi:hypothetical protein